MSSHIDVVCLSHLRWDFVFQRPQHLLTRCARERRVFYVEEPVITAGAPRLDVRTREPGLQVVTPQLPAGLSDSEAELMQRALLSEFFTQENVRESVLWFYTPMALPLAESLTPVATVFDCMDELSAFAGASPLIRSREAALFESVDHVFTGGQSLYESKRHRHPDVHLFPSSVDVAHFSVARETRADPTDQESIPSPRLGFYGVLDERLDLDLLQGVAEARPDWQLVMIGPVVKIDAGQLPKAPNIHYLGAKPYGELPRYLAGWDVALLPFARNEATRFISPTKTPEYLAAGRPVVSTSIRDVVHPYGELGLARIADTAAEFVAAVEAALLEDRDSRLEQVDRLLAEHSWDSTWERMWSVIENGVERRSQLVKEAQRFEDVSVVATTSRRQVATEPANPRPVVTTGSSRV